MTSGARSRPGHVFNYSSPLTKVGPREQVAKLLYEEELKANNPLTQNFRKDLKIKALNETVTKLKEEVSELDNDLY